MQSAKLKPGYLELYRSGELRKRAESLFAILKSCRLCPRHCHADRLSGQRGFCQAGKALMVSSFGPHFGEEAELVGIHGSGTIFLTHCNLGCLFCQNYDISHLGEGKETSLEELARQMLYLQGVGCHNINFVTPTHFVPQIVEALGMACDLGLRLPLVYNCGGYEALEVIDLLEGIFDIYMPDVKFSTPESSRLYCQADDYFVQAQKAVKEMHRQVGDLVVEEGVAVRGLLVRHLLMPNDQAGSREVFRFLAEEISRDTYVNIMDQYRPCFKAVDFHKINRRISSEEYREAVSLAHSVGLWRGFK